MSHDIYPHELAETLSKTIPSFEHIEAIPVEPTKKTNKTVHLSIIQPSLITYCDVLGCKTNLKMCAIRHKNLNNHNLVFFECEDCEIGKKCYEIYMLDKYIKEQNSLNEERKQFMHRQDEIDKKRAAIMDFANYTNRLKSREPENKAKTRAITDVSKSGKNKSGKTRQKTQRKRNQKSTLDK